MSKLSRRLITIFVAALATVAVFTACAQADPPVAMSGAYIGAADLSANTSFASWRGTQTTIVSDYLPYSNWSGVQKPEWWLNSWKPATTNEGDTLVLAVPLTTNAKETFKQGAKGDFDSDFLALGRALVADGDANAVLRLGWEFNGDWTMWHLTKSGGNSPAEFIADWRHVVNLLRSIPGENFKFDWNVSPGGAALGSAAYPGNAYVNYVGIDEYDDIMSTATPQARWNELLTQPGGLEYWYKFARAHDEPFSVPEWGLGTVDDPYFIEHMYSWMKSNDVAFESYFDYQHELTSGRFPKSAAKYRALWRGGLSGVERAQLRANKREDARALRAHKLSAKKASRAKSTTTV